MKEKLNYKFLILGFLIFLFGLINIGFSLPDSPGLYRGLRPLGMGNAFIAVSDDKDALFYNPAGLNDVEEGYIEIFNPTFDISLTIISVLQSMLDLNTEIGAAASDDEQSDILETAVTDNLGKFMGIRFAFTPGYTRKNFAIKLIGPEAKVRAQFRNNFYPQVQYRAFADMGLIGGGAYGWLDKMIQVGGAIKPIYRLDTGVVDLGAEDIDTIGDIITDFDQGGGVGLDFGVKSHLDTIANRLEIPIITKIANYTRPRFGMTYQDIWIPITGSVKFNRQSISMGGAINFDFWKLTNIFAFDVRDINQSGHLLSKICMGVETWFVKKWWAGRIGLNQGRPTIGGTLDLQIFRGDIALYYEEIGEHTWHKGDLRFAFQGTIGW